MKKSVTIQLLEFLQQNPGFHHNGFLQTLDCWRNKNGSRPTPRSLVRRLQELVEEGKAFVEYRGGQAYFSAEYKPKLVQKVEIVGGVAKISYVPA